MVGIGLVSFIPKKNANDDNEKRELVPMTGIDFQIKLMDYSAQVTIRQRFENRESNPIEATYEIILPRECAVTNFDATVGGQHINAVIREKEAAKDEYEDGIAAGGSAVLLENNISDDKPDVFRVSVGNLAPKEVATVSLTYVTTATVNDDGNIEFTLPAAQGHQDIVIAAPDNNNNNIAAEDNNSVADGIHLTADIEMGSNIRSVTSHTHKVTFELCDTPKRAKVTLNDTLKGGEDFTLAVLTSEPRAPSARIHRPSADKKNATVMASFFPDLEESFHTEDDDDIGVKEMIFIVDRSGSMSGSKVENAKSTLQLFLRSIPEGTLFNIVSFGSSFSKLFDGGSKALDDSTLAQATSHVSSMSADMGGTNLSRPLISVFSEPPRENIPRLLFVLTDGEVHDPEECMRSIREQAGTTRVFTFGIGRDASVALVRGMARAGEGICELIEDATNMREKVMRQLKRAVKPALTDLSITWENCGPEVHQAPHILPPLFHGSRLVAYGFVGDCEAMGDNAAVVLRGTLNGSKRFESRVALKDAGAVMVGREEEQITKLAAAALIRDLDEDRSYHGKNFGDKNKEIVRVSLENGVLSKLTAFVAVSGPKKEGGEAAQESMVERPVTIKPYVSPRSNHFGFGHPPMLFGCAGPRRMMRCCNAAPRMMTCSMASAPPQMMMGGNLFGCAAPRMMTCSMAAAPQPSPPPMMNRINLFGGSPLQQDKHFASPMVSCAMGAAPPQPQILPQMTMGGNLFGAAPQPQIQPQLQMSHMQAPPMMDGAANMNSKMECENDDDDDEAFMPVPMTQERIVLAQSANGSWAPEALAKLDTAFGDAMRAIPAKDADETLRRVWSTLVVVAILKKRYAATVGEWDLLRDKALTWVRKAVKSVGGGIDVNEWMKLAEDYVAKK